MKQVTLTRNAGGRKSGETIDVTDGVADLLIQRGDAEAVETEGEQEDDGSFYLSFKVDELKAEIAARNEDVADEEQIKPEGTNKPDLVAALEAHDKAHDVPAHVTPSDS